MKLVIVESPTKAKTISRFLGSEFQAESSYGHVRDLPKSKLGIDLEHNFEPQYIVPRKVQSRVTALKKALAKSDGVILATDEDREGEAIAWHLLEALNLNGGTLPIERIVFHEITESAIREALANPRELDMNLVDAQQARRVLDRLVGYKLSPFLWKKIARGLSAGRVQSVALRLIVDRENEIKKFKAEEYWTLGATFEGAGKSFESHLAKIDGETLQKLDIKNEAEVKKIMSDLERADYKVESVVKKAMNKNPSPPFTTSTLQQTAAAKLGLSAKKTMYLAQSLYENGHITYMRTDSVNLSKEALSVAASWIQSNLGKDYAMGPKIYKSKSRLAQEAHEAIRPTNVNNNPKSLKLEKDPARLYDLIWRRFVASQLPPARFEVIRAEIGAKVKKNYTFVSQGTSMLFDGYLKIWPMKFEEKELPALEAGQKVELEKLLPEQHFTEPPPRYNEASLIKTLEQYGIGRPSTYAPIISVIQERNYVEKNQGRFFPTEIGTLVNKVLTENFPKIVDIEFTAEMEEELDEVAEGKTKWQHVIKEFYDPFAKHLAEKYESVSKEELVQETTNEICEKCGKPMAVKFGRFGKFLACSGFPDCKNTKTLKGPPKSTGIKCPDCLASPERKDTPGELIERRVSRGRARGKIFWGCSRYPDCKHAVWQNPLGPKKDPEAAETKPDAE